MNFNASGESEPIISRYCTKKGTNAVEIFGLGGADSGRTLDLFGIEFRINQLTTYDMYGDGDLVKDVEWIESEGK